MRLAVFASGGGSNFQAIVDAIREEAISDVQIVLCVASRPNAGVVARSEQANIPVHILPSGFAPDGLPSLMDKLASLKVDLIALAGFMKMIPAALNKLKPEVETSSGQ